MTDLTKGIIEIEGFNLKPGADVSNLYNHSTENFISFGKFTVSSRTTKEALLASYGDMLSSVSGSRLLRFKMLFRISEEWFGCSFWFDNDGILSRIEMSPCVKYKSEDWDRTGQQEERRQFCDKWLFERLGPAHQLSTNVTHYFFDNIEIYSLSHFDVREGADAGYIIIEFNR